MRAFVDHLLNGNVGKGLELKYSSLYGMDIKITILNGKNSKQLEVTETKAPSAEIVRATSVERSCELSLRPSIERSTHSRNSGATWRRPRW